MSGYNFEIGIGAGIIKPTSEISNIKTMLLQDRDVSRVPPKSRYI